MFGEVASRQAPEQIDHVLALTDCSEQQGYSGNELREAMEAAGLEVSLFGDLDGRPYGRFTTPWRWSMRS